MTAIVLVWLGLVLLEAFRNLWLIEKKKVDIDHGKQVIIRCLFAIPFWIGSAIVVDDLPYDSWWAMPPMMAFTFWFLFDVSLNLMRGKSILYFGEGSKLDRLQAQWPLPWVWFKFLAAGASITVFYKGFDIL